MKTPLLLAPHDVHLLWGVEHWVVSARRGAASRVENGKYAGWPFDKVVDAEGVAITGTKAADGKVFPLLMKIIDAKQSLSLQVHPNAVVAPMLGGEPKSEAWYVISARPEDAEIEDALTGTIMAGLKDDCEPEAFMRAVAEGTAADHVVQYRVVPGDMCYLPGGTVHAIGGGVKIFEVQETSETTYRLYDWNRKDVSGRPRELKVAHGISSINWRVKGTKIHRRAIGTPYFTMRELDLEGRFLRALDTASFRAYFVVEGELEVSCGGETVRAGENGAVVVPADADEFVIAGKAKVIVTTL